MLGTDPLKPPGLRLGNCGEKRLNERLQMHHTIRRSVHDDDAEGEGRDRLLELDVAVHGYEDLELSSRTSQELTIVDTRPSAADDRVDLVAAELGGEILRHILVKQNAH
jgi:hypothetical protein